ncbi:hypothetical protein HNY73_005171 [Argiope bruennichi]|uniref:Uncharacterized protein n=1 Tax=Argiope bruennichi TaxID=94029 RepID=A0A8T0FGG7_ARGBR|nr:hypothetical protein HNY73_005171 [Argiope bruennichi]
MQEIATAHTARRAKNVIQVHFSVNASSRVFFHLPIHEADLKVSILRNVSVIPTEMLAAAVENAVVRLQHIVDRHLEHTDEAEQEV